MSKHMLVVGAGVVGAATALVLAEAGYRVTVIDQESALGMGASGANGGQLSYNYTDAMASPAMLKSLPKFLLGLDPAFRLRPALDSEFVRWSLSFIANCSAPQNRENTLAILKIALRSRLLMHRWLSDYRFKIAHRPAGKLHLYESKNAFESAKRMVEIKNRQGGTQSVVDKTTAVELEPALDAMNAKLVGAVYAPEDEVGDVEAFTKAALEQSMQLGGGELLLDTRFTGIVRDGAIFRIVQTNKGSFEVDGLVICAGTLSSHLARLMGIGMSPIIPVVGYSLDYPITPDTPDISLTDTARKMVLCRLGGRLRVAGMADVGHNFRKPARNRIQLLRSVLVDRFPLAGDYSAPDQHWVGARPMTADSRPIIKRTEIHNVYINAGHGMLGWTLAAGSAQTLMNIIEG